MDYSHAIEYIENIVTDGFKPELKRIEYLLELLDNPQNSLNVIHVAGTNGKGSTCAMLESILRHSGYSVGLYTSPHLERYNERIKFNGTDIDDTDFCKLTQYIAQKCNDMVKAGKQHPSIFEFITAIAFCYFKNCNPDFVILEVGIGGRFDATNTVKSPLVSIITSIGFDHTEYLGNTLESIAFEKGGIIKKNCPTVLYFNSDRVYNVIENLCIENNSKLYYSSNLKFDIKYDDLDKMIFSIETDFFKYSEICMNMIGQYQIYNAATALLAVEVLKDLGIEISNVLHGIGMASWAGRMEIVSSNPYMLLDGAHNPDGIEMLYNYIKSHFKSKSITLVIGIFKDKQYQQMANIMDLVDNIVITEPPSSRALSVDKLKSLVLNHNPNTYVHTDVCKAIEIANNITKSDGIIICTGSLYLIGKIRNIVMRRKNND